MFNAVFSGRQYDMFSSCGNKKLTNSKSLTPMLFPEMLSCKNGGGAQHPQNERGAYPKPVKSMFDWGQFKPFGKSKH